MSALHQMFTRNIRGSFPIYPVSLTLLAFTPTAATVTLVKFDPCCHVNQITRKGYLGCSPNFTSQVGIPLGICQVNLVCLYATEQQLHRLE